MKILYCAQFHEICGYSHAAIGYLNSLDSVIDDFPEIELKILSVSLDPRKITEEFHKNKTNKKDLQLFDKYHFSDQREFDAFVEDEYVCLWHMTSILPTILERPDVGVFYKNIKANVQSVIIGSTANYHLLAWETDEIPQEYKESIKRYSPKVVITPSEWNTQTVSKFCNSITIPHLINLEDPVVTEEIVFPENLKDKFVILSISEWVNRKNFESLIKSYICEFYDHKDTLLLIKTSLPNGVKKEDFVSYIGNIKNSIRTFGEKNNNVIVILDYLSKEKMNYLYKICDLFALTSYGEGFSLPTSDAVKSSRPVLCTSEGGHIDYICPENPFFIEGIWDTVFDVPPYDLDGNWFVPSVKSIREKLRKAYEIWKSKPSDLHSIAADNLERAAAGCFSKERVGKRLFNVLASTAEIFPNKTTALKSRIANLDLEDKMKILYNSFEGEECFILNCGPSLRDYDKDKLSSFLKDKLVLSVKQAYDIFSEVTDFHFFNCSNLPIPDNVFSSHYNYDHSTISVGSSNYPQYTRWGFNQISDVFFKIPIRTEINNEFLVRTGKIEDFLINKNLERPCGPGIMYETVLFTAIHLGVKKITCIGWDLTKEKVNVSNYEHFYGNNKNLFNKGDILDWEIKETREFSKPFYEWCSENNIELCLASDKSSLWEEIPRITLEL